MYSSVAILEKEYKVSYRIVDVITNLPCIITIMHNCNCYAYNALKPSLNVDDSHRNYAQWEESNLRRLYIILIFNVLIHLYNNVETTKICKQISGCQMEMEGRKLAGREAVAIKG